MMQVSATRLTILGICVVLLVPFIVVMGFAASDANNDGVDDYANQQLPGGALRPDAPIPNPSWALWVNRAGALCKDVTPALAAAQVDAESSWDPTAVARNPAERGGDAIGLAQFQQGTWDSWGKDFDGDGTNSPFDPEDAIMALGTLMCDLTRWARAAIKDGSLAGDPLDLALVAYFCGRACVLEVGGVPAAGLAHEYPGKVRSKITTYAASPVIVVGGWSLPLAKGQYEVGSPFGPRGGRLHAGVDLIARRETPIYAASAGTVIVVKCDDDPEPPYRCDSDGSPSTSGCGWMVDIRHADGVITRYCHQILKPIVEVEQQVAAGDQIGWVGSSGRSSGPHLHFEVHLNNDRSNAGAVDPIAFLRSAGLDP